VNFFIWFAIYYSGIVFAYLVQVVVHPTTRFTFRDAFIMLGKSFGSWFTVIHVILKQKRL